MQRIKKRIRFTVFSKLMVLIALLLGTALVFVTWFSTRLFIQDNTVLIHNLAADAAERSAALVRAKFEQSIEKMRLIGRFVTGLEAHSPARKLFVQDFFKQEKDVLGLVMLQVASRQTDFVLTPVLESMYPDANALLSLFQTSGFALDELKKGDVQIATRELADGTLSLLLGIPWTRNETTASVLLGIFKQDILSGVFAADDLLTSYVVDSKGTVLVHPDVEMVWQRANFSQKEIIRNFLTGTLSSYEREYQDPVTGQPMLGALSAVGFGRMGVVAEMPHQKGFEVALRVKKRTGIFSLIVLSLAFLFGYFFSDSITLPIHRLSAASEKIADGNFNVQLKVKGSDELAELTHVFNHMALGLQEREKLRETFNKFHNPEIVKQLLQGNVKLGGEHKQAVVLFTDIRDFTAMSEKLSPEKVVDLLNEYLTRMVTVIRAHGGIVDKFIGDAILAIWGVPVSQPGDTQHALRAALAMREELNMLNGVRISRGQDPLRIGMGLTAGGIIAGNIGSQERMEYTAIGDAVNLASRIQTMTKERGLDLLVDRSIAQTVLEQFIFQSVGTSRVRGKNTAVELYKVLGYVTDTGERRVIQTPYSEFSPLSSVA